MEDLWENPECNPIDDIKRALMLNDAFSEMESEIFIEGLMGKRKLDGGLVCDLMFGKQGGINVSGN